MSTEGQVDGTSIDTQRAQCAELATGHGLRLVAEYVDAGVSGAAASRPALDELLAVAATGDVQVIVVAKLDRLGRSLLHLLELLTTLDAAGVRVLSATDGIDTRTPARRLILQLLGARAGAPAMSWCRALVKLQPLCERLHRAPPSTGSRQSRGPAVGVVQVLAAAPTLIGRDEEIVRLEKVLDRGLRSGGAVHIYGPPGIGKSALLAHLEKEARRRGAEVLAAQGSEAETHLAFACLHQLLRPALAQGHDLSARHRAALDAAFGYTVTSEPIDRFLIGVAALELLSAQSARAPVLAAIDDMPWVDSASSEVLSFIARRVEGERILVAFTSRIRLGEAPAAGHAHSLSIVLSGLSAADAERLLVSAAPALSARDRRRVLEAAAGNPLALVELPSAVANVVPGDIDEYSQVVSITAHLERAFSGRLDQIGGVERDALLVAAVLDSNRLDEVRDAVSHLLQRPVRDLTFSEASAQDLVSCERAVVRFRHPLVRSSIIHSAGPARTRAAHLALAQTLERTDRDRSTWHRAASTASPDETVAAALEQAAGRAIRRGAADTAQAWLERAAYLSSQDQQRGRRLLEAAEVAFELGRAEAVQELVAHARALQLAPIDRARLAGIEGMFDDGVPSGSDHVRRLLSSAEQAIRDGEQDVPASLLVAAARSCHWGVHTAELRARVRGVSDELALEQGDPRRLAVDALLAPFQRAKMILPSLSAWIEGSGHDGIDAGGEGLLGLASFVSADFDSALWFSSRSVDHLRRQGRAALQAQSLVLQSFAALYLGRWDITHATSAEAGVLCTDTGQSVWAACALLGQANVAGLRGNLDDAMHKAAEVERVGLRTGNVALLNGVQLTRGLAALGSSRVEAAADYLSRMMAPNDAVYHNTQSPWAIDYYAEACAMAGRAEAARQTLERVEADTNGTPALGIRRALCLAWAAIATEEEVERRLDEAQALAPVSSSWYRARVDLLSGLWLRRQRRISEARIRLQAATAAFDAIGATAWSARAQSELAVGGRAKGLHGPVGWARLSGQELQIARLAARGMSNREIGNMLYLSHRTVGSHLYRIYPKLGLRSRTELHLVIPPD